MGRKLTITIEEADRGNVVRIENLDAPKKQGTGWLEIIEGSQGSVNLKDRTRRRLCELVADWYPADRTAKTT